MAAGVQGAAQHGLCRRIYFSPLRYTAVISTKGWMGNQQMMDTQMTLQGEYVGACQ